MTILRPCVLTCVGWIALLAVGLSLGHVFTAPTAQADVAASPARPSRGGLELQASRVFVHVDKTGFGHEHGIEGTIRAGRIMLRETENAGELVFDMRTFVADTDRARQYVGLEGSTGGSTAHQVTENMLGSSVLDVERYPTATFRVDSATPITERSRRDLPQYRLVGKFTLHGVTRPLTVIADVEEKNGWTHLRGEFTVLQTDFGIRPFTKALGAVGVADRLTIYGDVWIAGT